jgi:hypothetical protein
MFMIGVYRTEYQFVHRFLAPWVRSADALWLGGAEK